jgi:hypothetical protein
LLSKSQRAANVLTSERTEHESHGARQGQQEFRVWRDADPPKNGGGNFNEQLVKAGIMLVGEGLKPSSAGVRVHFSGKDRTVTDGPFAETKELVAGYWIWQVQSMEEAIAWLKRCPNPMTDDSDVEIRPIWSPEDVDEAIKKELQQEQER